MQLELAHRPVVEARLGGAFRYETGKERRLWRPTTGLTLDTRDMLIARVNNWGGRSWTCNEY